MSKTIIAKLETPGAFLSGVLVDIVPPRANIFITKPTLIFHDKEETLFFEIPETLQKIDWNEHLNHYIYIARNFNIVNKNNNFVSPTYIIYTEPIREEVC